MSPQFTLSCTQSGGRGPRELHCPCSDAFQELNASSLSGTPGTQLPVGARECEVSDYTLRVRYDLQRGAGPLCNFNWNRGKESISLLRRPLLALSPADRHAGYLCICTLRRDGPVHDCVAAAVVHTLVRSQRKGG